MKEIREIIKSYIQAEKEGKRTALATVVKVDGSSYRRPGARMLVTEDGQLTGAISGGCLEGDALRKALTAIVQQKNKLVTYDTTDEDDAKFGIQLGCNGIVHILFEPIRKEDDFNPLRLLEKLENKRENAVLVTLFSLDEPEQAGTTLLYRNSEPPLFVATLLQEKLVIAAAEVLVSKTSAFRHYEENGKPLQAFIEFVPPAVALIIAGAGNDAQPLAKIAGILGWQVTIADGRPAHASTQRFPTADQVLVTKPAFLLDQLDIDEKTAFVLMTHNYNYDLVLLGQLLKINVPYIGVLGPKSKMLRMLEELGMSAAINSDRLYGPVGLDIGAETAEEIALSIVSEIKTVFSRSSGMMLRDKKLPIHHHAII